VHAAPNVIDMIESRALAFQRKFDPSAHCPLSRATADGVVNSSRRKMATKCTIYLFLI